MPAYFTVSQVQSFPIKRSRSKMLLLSVTLMG